MLFDQVLNNSANRLREIIAVILDWCDNKPKTPYRAKGVNPAAWKHNLEHANLPKPSNIVTAKRRATPAARSLRRRCAGPATASTPPSRSTAWGARSVIGSETTPSSPESLPNLPSLTPSRAPPRLPTSVSPAEVARLLPPTGGPAENPRLQR